MKFKTLGKAGSPKFGASIHIDAQKLNKMMLLTNAQTLSGVVRTSVHRILIPQTYKYIKDQNAVDTGALMKSIDTRIVDRGYKKTVAVEVGTFGVGYGLPVERGTKPHWPNINNLKGWVRRKLQVPLEDVDSVTYLIARSIATKGTRPHPYLIPAYYATENELESDIHRRIQALIF
jgi:hypothetical protein